MVKRIHFSGVAGAGMNPLAQLLAHRGEWQVTGSDRALDAGQCAPIRQRLEAAGVAILPQDGSAVTAEVDRFIYSAAVEQDTPEMRAAKEKQIESLARPALLAEIVDAGRPGLAVAGTSGKSTVVGMIAWILKEFGQPITVLGGAALAERGAQHMGCFIGGPSDGPVVAEACESDGTLVGYHPGIGLIHNITRDHEEVHELRNQFATFASQSKQLIVNADDPEAFAFYSDGNSVSYGQGNEQADWRMDVLRVGPWRGQAEVLDPEGNQHFIDLPQPGLHNLENALAALVSAVQLGVPAKEAAKLLSTFPGVARRFRVLGQSEHAMTVVDDYAHNGAKIAAAIKAAQEGCDRLLAIFQPHGFGPARFLRSELKEMIPQLLRPADRFCYGEIFFAGGTVSKDISSADLASDINCHYAPDHMAIIEWACENATPGDTILLMGARDPKLGDLAKAILDSL